MMKKSPGKTIFRSLASACFIGSSCCSALLFGQQQTPTGQDDNDSLPPIVSASSVQFSSGNAIPPVVSDSMQSPTVPPIISVDELMAKETGQVPTMRVPQTGRHRDAAGIETVNRNSIPTIRAPRVAELVGSRETTSQGPPKPSAFMEADSAAMIQKGTNFPTDGDRRIAEFINANARSLKQVSSNSPAATSKPVGPQEVSPSDISNRSTPSVMPTSMTQSEQNHVYPEAITNAPSIRGQALIQPTGSSFLQSQGSYQQIPGTDSYFETGSLDASGYQTDVSVDFGPRDATFDCCGFIRPARNYLIVDALYWRRNDGVFRASNITSLNDYDNTFGGRVTWGKKRDSTRGYEFSYMQFDPWIASTSQNSAGSLVGALFGNPNTNNLPPGDFSAFQNGTFAEQFHKTEFKSFEANRTWWGSDVAKAFVGARFISFDDEFRLSMANTLGEQGVHSLQAKNSMFGIHTGMEVLYDIGYRLSFSYGAKFGGYANFRENSLTHINAGTVAANNFIENTEISWNAEFGVWARYKLTPNIRFRAGYEMLALFNVYEAESTYTTVVSSSNANIFNDGDAWFHGPSFGFEIYR